MTKLTGADHIHTRSIVAGSNEAGAAESSPKTTAPGECHLLRIPRELRLEIYRCLLLPHQKLYVSVPHSRSPPPHAYTCKFDDFDSEDGWTDESEEDDSDRDSFISMMMQDFLSDYEEDSDEDSTDDEYYDDVYIKRDLEILRANKQIHSEASALWYSEVVLTLEPADIFCLSKNPMDLEFGHADPEMLWKHNPLKGVGKTDQSGKTVYDSPELKGGGDVEPHIFAKFQKVFFDAHFDDNDTRSMVLWIDDDTHVIREDDATRFKKLVNSSNIFKHLAKILSNSFRISHLELQLEVEVIPESNLIIEDEDLEDILADTIEEDNEREMEIDRIMEIANFRATELLLESKAMKPLTKLHNVANCELSFGFSHLPEAEAYNPSAKYVKILKQMKDKIEGSYQEPMEV